jgi:hypothetical protein
MYVCVHYRANIRAVALELKLLKYKKTKSENYKLRCTILRSYTHIYSYLFNKPTPPPPLLFFGLAYFFTNDFVVLDFMLCWLSRVADVLIFYSITFVFLSRVCFPNFTLQQLFNICRKKKTFYDNWWLPVLLIKKSFCSIKIKAKFFIKKIDRQRERLD